MNHRKFLSILVARQPLPPAVALGSAIMLGGNMLKLLLPLALGRHTPQSVQHCVAGTIMLNSTLGRLMIHSLTVNRIPAFPFTDSK